jgi:predicted nucleotidyltransferase
MKGDRFVPPDMWRRIVAELDAIERQEGVRILLAVESGSRAWRFPSQDSDFDVRFLYVRPEAAYLSVRPSRDTIERPLDRVLDVNGWDLRKALGLMLNSNAALLEWLCSPIRYRDAGAAVARLHDMARDSCTVPRLAYHYDRLARHGLTATAEEAPRMKDYCYALRPALALAWIQRHAAPPPMDLPSLLEGIEVPVAVRETIADLLERKLAGAEGDLTARLPALDAFIAALLTEPVESIAVAEHSTAVLRADAFFAELVRTTREQ